VDPDGDAASRPDAATTDELNRLMQEEAALRGVAALIATAGPSDDVLTAICRAASEQVDGQDITLLRFESADTIVAVATYGGPVPPGVRVVHRPGSLSEQVARTERPVRIDDFELVSSAAIVRQYGIRAGVGVPIFIEGRVWGMFSVTSHIGPLPDYTESRLEGFAQLTWAAIANVDARDNLRRIADEQAALRQVAELVAREAPLAQILAAVVEEGTRVLGAASTMVLRDDGGESHPLAVKGLGPTGDAHRVDAAIVVHGRTWGTVAVISAASRPIPLSRVKPFADLIAVAIANAENLEGLTQSRARVIAAADDARRRLQRDVHDGAQQRLVHTIISLKLARDRAANGGDVSELIAEALTNAQDANQQLRDIVRGILPAALIRSGLAAGIESLMTDAAIHVDLDLALPRLPVPVETTAYFAVAEAMTNTVKHASASRISISGAVADDVLLLVVTDDGTGGADPAAGTGLTGLADRIEAIHGAMTVESPVGVGTRLTVRIPVERCDGAVGL
jgi:signal transduction histidine kinase